MAYTDSVVCRECHAEVWETYRHTGMARSLYAANAPSMDEHLAGGGTYYHRASERYYTMIERGGRYYQRRHQLDSTGRQTNVVEKEIHYVMGSGNHARTYLHLTPRGKLIELPLGWYAANGGRWGMNPGYDRANHDGFQRVVAFDCMFCHSGYPETAPGADLPGSPVLYTTKIIEGVDCQRCHGPGKSHVDAARAGSAEAIYSTIVNPARLEPERQMEVCFQCHLETTSRPLPNILHRFGRGFFSYRPGEPLADFALYFDHAEGSKRAGKFEINHSAYQLRRSACFLASGGALTCLTCHNPHEPAHSDAAATRFDPACLGCHETGLSRIAAHEGRKDCTGCHMPARRTEDVVHAVVTDHRIQRRPPENLLAPLPEKSTLEETIYRGEVVPYYPATASGPEDELYFAVAQVLHGSNLEKGIERLRALIETHGPDEPGFYFELGAAYEQAQELAEAARWFEHALRMDPTFALARWRLGSALSQAGELSRADDVLRQAESDDPLALRERGLNAARAGDFEQAVEATRRAIAIDPDLPELHNNLGGALAALGRTDEAEAAIREAIRLQPDLAEARFNLGNLLAAKGETDGAEFQWIQAIRSRLDYSAARYNYAVILAGAGRYPEARDQLNTVLLTEPSFGPARDLLEELEGPP